jgi:hypothetical protein
LSLASVPFHEGCAVCGTHFHVELPKELVDAARKRRLVVFAGAGISTEAPGLFPESFYEEIEARLRDDASNEPFPVVMQQFEDLYGRAELVKTMLERIDYVSTFLSLQNRSTAFHQEIATIGQLDAIFTTNWDDFFERFSGARSFVLDADFAFFEMPGRRVMKVHGSTSNLSTIVATTADYARREADLGSSVMGAKLRDFLSTKVIVFIGYSLTDSDFQSVYRSVIERMGGFRPSAYVVTPVESVPTDFGLTHLRTDGGHFAHLLKSALEESGAHVPDKNLERAAWMRQVILSAHVASESLMADESLFGCFTLAYQDGILAALGRMSLLRSKGEYSEPEKVRAIVHSYSHLFANAIELRRHFDAAYIEGYLIATMSLLLTDEECLKIPIIETFSSPTFRARRRDPHLDLEAPWWLSAESPTLSAYIRAGDAQQSPPTAWLRESALAARALTRRTPGVSLENRAMYRSFSTGQVPQHTEFLDGIPD